MAHSAGSMGVMLHISPIRIHPSRAMTLPSLVGIHGSKADIYGLSVSDSRLKNIDSGSLINVSDS